MSRRVAQALRHATGGRCAPTPYMAGRLVQCVRARRSFRELSFQARTRLVAAGILDARLRPTPGGREILGALARTVCVACNAPPLPGADRCRRHAPRCARCKQPSVDGVHCAKHGGRLVPGGLPVETTRVIVRQRLGLTPDGHSWSKAAERRAAGPGGAHA